ncbi:hypothetical protein LEP1GSC195_1391 [Leptospira wolbachii serovar Codice str. CDC]|uniref:Uncharacterized protein n=1 Tax=Leptospira wolbachii serovar Codice str. CDC TaxID=1218599 RepID=R8ZXV6_9LEPT|nr:hypothetical protein LEP1GSC195_1391 [Leptospira wolbachii serovar Codice str. CDC]
MNMSEVNLFTHNFLFKSPESRIKRSNQWKLKFREKLFVSL